MNKEWLSLSGAAEILGVHPSTVRKWSDEGKLPVHVTQGGHRRYRLTEVEAWSDTHSAPQRIDIDQLLDQVLDAVRVHIQNQPLEAESWYVSLDAETREHYRSSGRSLAHAILFFLASTNDSPSATMQARSVGIDYSNRSRKFDISAGEAVRAYLFFRGVVLGAILKAYQGMRGGSPAAWAEMLRRFNLFTDQIVLAIVENYEAHGGFVK